MSKSSFLKKVISGNYSIEAAYAIIRILRHVAVYRGIGDVEAELKRQKVESRDVIFEGLAVISSEIDRDILKINKVEVDHYVAFLEEFIRRKSHQNRSSDPGRGQTLLAELRKLKT